MVAIKNFNLSKKQISMPKLPLEARIKDFSEIELGYTENQAKSEAMRCLNCKHKPCVAMCPLNINIPGFISSLLEDNMEKACSILYKSNSMPGICSRVCPSEKQCELGCVRGKNGEPVSISALERYVSDNGNHKIETLNQKNNIKIAVIGSGPSGLSCARELAILGYCVTIFESSPLPGGLLAFGIPKFRLPKEILDKEIDNLNKLGVEIRTNTSIGKDITIKSLFSDYNYKYIYIATGSGTPKNLGIPGESLPGVYFASEFLEEVNSLEYNLSKKRKIYKSHKTTVVIGGGNVAIDAARCARRLGSEVTVIYRRGETDMPARKEEIESAKIEGVKFEFFITPAEIILENNSLSINCIKTKYLYNEENTEKKLCTIKNSSFSICADCVLVAVGSFPGPIIKNINEEIKCDSDGKIIIDEKSMQTSDSKIYAGGDAVTGAKTVVLAIKAGKQAAMSIHKDFLNNGDVLK